VIGMAEEQGAESKETVPVVTEPPKPESQQTASSSAADDAKSASAFVRTSWSGYYHDHRNAVVYGIAGGIVGLSILVFGFWPVVLIVITAIIGVIYGQYRDGDPRIVGFFRRHFGG